MTVPKYLFKKFRFLFVPYPFYCIDPIFQTGTPRIRKPKKLTYILKVYICIENQQQFLKDKSYVSLPDEYLFKRVIHGILLHLAANGEKITINTLDDNVGKLFNGGFKI